MQGSWRTNLEQVLGRACVFALHGGSQSLMQGRAEQTCGKWRKQNVVAPPRSSAGRPTSWLWSLPRGQLPCDLSFVERLRFDGNPEPNTYENQHCPSGRFGSQTTPRFNILTNYTFYQNLLRGGHKRRYDHMIKLEHLSFHNFLIDRLCIVVGLGRWGK